MNMKLRGKIKFITEENGIEKVLEEVENSVTELYEENVAAFGIEGLYCGMGAIEAGQTFLSTPTPYYPTTAVNYGRNKNYNICAYFLNLPEATKTALTKKSKTLPLYTSTYEIDDSVIVGYATGTYTATEAKQGYIDAVKGTNLINSRRHTVRFKWDVGVMNGEYNAVVIGMNVMTDKYNGICLYRGIESNNVILGETASGGYMVGPSVKSSDGVVYTSDTEILLGDSTETKKARKVLDLVSGEETILESTDHRYDFPLHVAHLPQLTVGNYLVFANDLSSVHKMDLTTKAVTSLATGSGMFLYNNYLYVRYNATTFRAYTTDTLTYTSSANLTLANMNIPEEFTAKISTSGYYMGITSVGNKYMVYLWKSKTLADVLDKCLICTDPTDVANSIVEILPQVNTQNAVEINGEMIFFAKEVVSPLYIGGFGTYATDSSTTAVQKRGVKFSKNSLCGNLFSFKTFDTPKTIETDKPTIIEYSYTFEQ